MTIVIQVMLAFLVGSVAGSILFVICRALITLLAWIIPDHIGPILFWATIVTGFGWLLLQIIEKNTGYHL